MLKENQLNPFLEKLRFHDGEGVDLENLEAYILHLAEEQQIPLASKDDTIKGAGLLNRETFPCIVFYHPEHENDYYKFVIQLKRQGKYAFMYSYYTGQSKQLQTLDKIDRYRNQRAKSQDIENVAKAWIKEKITSLGTNKQRVEDEKNYYACIKLIFDEL